MRSDTVSRSRTSSQQVRLSVHDWLAVRATACAPHQAAEAEALLGDVHVHCAPALANGTATSDRSNARNKHLSHRSNAPKMAADPDDVALAVDTLWLLLGGCLVFFMHSGFALLEVGSVSVRNTQVRTETLVRQHVS
jgi:hypothetical protein